MAVPWFRRLVAGLLLPGFDPKSVHVKCVGQNGAGPDFSPSTWDSSQSLSLCKCSVLIFIYTLVLQDGLTGKAWEPSEIRGQWIENLSFSFFLK